MDRWEARDVAARTTFAIEVTDTTLPGIVRAIRTTTADRWALIAAGGGVVLTLIVALQRRVWRARPAPDDLARARRLLAELQDPNQRTDPAHAAMRDELVDLIERRPDLGELRRDRASQGPARRGFRDRHAARRRGIQRRTCSAPTTWRWIPAFAGMTELTITHA